MNRNTGFTVNASSLIDLKAELIKKKEEFNKSKSKNAALGFVPQPEKKKGFWEKTNKGVNSRAEKDLEAQAAEEKSLSKSKSALEAKALLYDKLSKGTSNLADDNKGLFLVNFRQKVNETAIPTKDYDTEDISLQNNYPASNSDEEWVEYTDSLGRSKTCMRKYLPDDAIRLNVSTSGTLKADLQSQDMRREHQRKLWEEEEQEAMRNPVRDIHYQNVQFNEVRTHGVGYYSFSKDEEERQKQMESLDQLRKQTQKQHDNREKILEKRKAMMAERLAKVRERKNLNVELPFDEPKEDTVPEISEEDKIVELEKKLKEIEAEHTRKDHVRPWDEDKLKIRRPEKRKLTQDEWVSEKREERVWEFAPLQMQNQKENITHATCIKKDHVPKTSPTEPKNKPEETIFYKNINLEDIPIPEPSTANTEVPEEPTLENIEKPSVEDFQASLSQTLSYFRNQP